VRLRDATKLSLVSGLIFVACIAPWTVRNYVVFHRFIPLRSNFGLEWWLENHSELPDRSLHPANYLPERDKYVRMTEIPYMDEKEREASQFVRTHPAAAAEFALHRFVYTWLDISESPEDLWRTIPLFLKVFIVANCAFTLLALLGALLALHSQSPAASPLAGVLLIYPLVFYLTHSELRYRFPIDSLMLIFAVYAVTYPLARLAGRRAAPLPEIQRRTAEQSFT
jgi:hypothetical protein